MAIMRKRPAYIVGFVLYFVALMLCIISLAVPGQWFYLKEEGSKKWVGQSIWRLDFPACLGGHENKPAIRCNTFSVDYAKGEKAFAVASLVAGVVWQLSACIAIVLYNKRAKRSPLNCRCEILAGTAAVLSFTGIVTYTAFTHKGLNITYGPGYFLNCIGIGVSFVGIMLTGTHDTRLRGC